MTKVTMPDPVAWLHICRKKPDLRGLLYEKSAPELAARGFVPEPLITTDQAEAYADARVREALEEAVMILIDTAIMLRANTEAIRALIPTTK